MGGHDIFIEKLSENDHTFGSFDGMHVHNAHVGRFGVLRAPIVARAAIDHIPPQIIYWDHLGRNRGLFRDGPLRRPSVSVLHHVHVPCRYGWANHGGPAQLELNIGRSVSRMKRPHLEAIQRRVGKKAGVIAGQIVHEFRLGELGLVGQTFISLLPVVSADIIAKIANCCFRS